MKYKRLSGGALIFIVMLGIIFSSGKRSIYCINWNLKSVEWIGRQVESFFIPQLMGVKYDGNHGENGTWIISQALSMTPIIYQYNQAIETSSIAVDSTSEAWILKAQAIDENYIDGNGELVGEEVVIEPNTEDYQVALDIQNIEELAKLQDIDYILSNYYVIDKTVSVGENVMNPTEWVQEDLSLADDVDGPQVLIYHTHSQEAFVDSVAGDMNTTVTGVGGYLGEVLTEKYGIEVLHHEGVYDLVDGVLDRSKAYDLAYDEIVKIIEANPSIELVIDLHRDGVGEDTHLVTMIDGKPTAQIMYFNGLSSTLSNGNISYLENPYIQDNLAITFQMQLASEAMHPGFSRRIYLKSYRYNLHLMPKTMLIEAGAQTNTLEEMYNAMDVLAEVLNTVVGK